MRVTFWTARGWSARVFATSRWRRRRVMWNQIPVEQMNPRLSRQVKHCETMTVARVMLQSGCIVPEHSHHNEQVSLMQSGRVKFVVGGVDRIVGPGDSVHMPPHVPHWVEAL